MELEDRFLEVKPFIVKIFVVTHHTNTWIFRDILAFVAESGCLHPTSTMCVTATLVTRPLVDEPKGKPAVYVPSAWDKTADDSMLGKMIGLKYPGDIRSLCFLIAKFASVVAHWMLSPYLGKWTWAVSVLGFIPAFMTCCITHNAMHCTMFKNKTAESTFRAVLSLGLGHPVQLYNPTHNHNHHVHTQTDLDHISTNQMQYQQHWKNLLYYFFHIVPSVAALEGIYVKEEWKKRGTTFYRIATQMALLYGIWAYLIFVDWQRFLACVYLPGYLGIYGILSISMLQHDGCEVSEPMAGKDMDVNSARNFVDPSLNYFTMNNGYHSVHHMFPNTHWTKYKPMHQELIEPKIKPELDDPSILGYIWRTHFYPGVLPAHRRNKVA